MNRKYLFKKAWFGFTNFFRPTLKGVVCGHETKRAGEIVVFGESSIMEMPVNEEGHPDYCLDCIAKMSIRCAWCGGAIKIGALVTLYIPQESFVVPEYAVCYQHGEHEALVGCLRWDCADTGADMCGRWMPPGNVERFPSPIELALQGNNMVIVPNVELYPKGVIVSPR